jgi:glycosyltransferase involved in cell wall biosynthesis
MAPRSGYTCVISVIVTVLNEGAHIHRLMQSLAAQTRPPDEVVIVDGGSRDNTVASLHSYADRLPLRILIAPGCNISAGRNRAIAAARGGIIAVTDAGVELARDWLEHLTGPLRENPAVQAVGGFFQAAPHTPFELALGATVLPLVDEINPATFLPSSRSVAFRKSAWERVGGYPEWLDYCEDLIFDLKLKQIVGDFAFAPEAVADFRPRSSLSAFFKQYYRYARGDGKADLWRKRHAIRYLTYCLAAPLILVAGFVAHPLCWLLYVPGAVYYLYQPYRRLRILIRNARYAALLRTPYSALSTFLFIPIMRVGGDIAKMLGYPVGLWWRWRHRPPDWRHII